MKYNLKKIVLALAVMFWGVGLMAQDAQSDPQKACCPEGAMLSGQQLTSNSFALDAKTSTVVIIDTPENVIAVLHRNDKGFDVVKKSLIDEYKGRHDVAMIYKPKSVAIYDNQIVFLAANRDSSFVGVMSMDENPDIYKTNTFAGSCTALSIENGHIYLAGASIGGFTAMDIDLSQGLKSIVVDTVSNEKAAFLNYRIPKKADEIAQHDPYGLGLTIIAMSTVFLALVVISIVLMGFGRSLQSFQRRKASKSKAKEEGANNNDVAIQTEDGKKKYISGDEFASIAAAIYMYNEELHDEEPTIITIMEVNRRYSPWSSKLHNMNIYRR